MKLDSKQVKGRMVFSIMDKSKECINVNVWGSLSSIRVNEGDILAINGARVTSFGGKSLNVSQEHAKIIINPSKNLIENLDEFVDLTTKV